MFVVEFLIWLVTEVIFLALVEIVSWPFNVIARKLQS